MVRRLAVRADVTDDFALGSLATTAVEEFGHLDIWVNDAGGAEVGKPLTDLERREWDEVVELNFTAVWNGVPLGLGAPANVAAAAVFLASPAASGSPARPSRCPEA